MDVIRAPFVASPTGMPQPRGNITGHDPDWARFDDHTRLRVVGESYRQDALIRATGAPTVGEFRYECLATLVPEPDNPHDHWAVKVEIDGHHVGYLPRGSAKRYHLRLVSMREVGLPTHCFAFVGRQPDGGNPNLGVSLRVPRDGPLLKKR